MAVTNTFGPGTNASSSLVNQNFAELQRPRGDWSGATAYGINDSAFHSAAWWLCLVAHTNSEPVAGNANWRILGVTEATGDGGGGMTAEQVQDIVASFLVAGSGVQVTYDDANNTFTILNSAPLSVEQIQDTVAAMIAAGSNLTSTYNDAAGTLTLSATGDGTGLTTEQVQDIVAALLVSGTNVTLTYDDASGALTIGASGGGSVTYGTTAGTAAQGNDPRIVNAARTDTANTFSENQTFQNYLLARKAIRFLDPADDTTHGSEIRQNGSTLEISAGSSAGGLLRLGVGGSPFSGGNFYQEMRVNGFGNVNHHEISFSGSRKLALTSNSGIGLHGNGDSREDIYALPSGQVNFRAKNSAPDDEAIQASSLSPWVNEADAANPILTFRGKLPDGSLADFKVPKNAPAGGSGADAGTWSAVDVVAINGATTLTAAAVGKTHVCSGTTTNYTITLPNPADCAGKILQFQMSGALTKLVTLSSSQLIDGINQRVMWAGESAVLWSDGATWSKIAGKSIPFTARGNRNGALNIAANVAVKIPLDFSGSDPSGLIVDTTNGRLRAPRNATYSLAASVIFAALPSDASEIQSRIHVGGSLENAVSVAVGLGKSAGYPCYPCSYTTQLNTGTVVELFTKHTCTSATELYVAETLNWISIEEVPQW